MCGFMTLFANPEYVKGVYGAAVWFLVGIIWFAFHARHNLILSPEEEFAQHAKEASRPL